MAYISYKRVGSTWLQQHPNIGACVHIVVTLLRYVVSGRWIVDFVRWLVITGGTIAESAFLLATVYVTVNTVAHMLVTWVLPERTISTLNQMSVIAFSVLPELITFSAIKVTYDHWKMAMTTKRIDAYFWCICYSIPTMVFLVMTIITITSFISIEATGTTSPQATGAMLVVRCLAGWSYSMIQMLFASIGRQGYADVFDRLSSQVQLYSNTVTQRDITITTVQKEIVVLRERVAMQERELFESRMALATRRMAHMKRGMHIPKRDGEQMENTEDYKSALNKQEVHSLAQMSALSGEQTVHSQVSTQASTSSLASALTEEQTVHFEGHQSTPDCSLDSEQEKAFSTQTSALIREQIVPSEVHKTVRRNQSNGSDAVKKVQQILRRNPNTGPAELAVKAGVSKRYASQIKATFLASLSEKQLV